MSWSLISFLWQQYSDCVSDCLINKWVNEFLPDENLSAHNNVQWIVQQMFLRNHIVLPIKGCKTADCNIVEDLSRKSYQGLELDSSVRLDIFLKFLFEFLLSNLHSNHCTAAWSDFFLQKWSIALNFRFSKNGKNLNLGNHLLSSVNIKSKLKITSNFVAFSEKLKFILSKLRNIHTICFLSILQVRDGTILVLKTSNLQPQVTSTLV